jgi:hypothetical protein
MPVFAFATDEDLAFAVVVTFTYSGLVSFSWRNPSGPSFAELGRAWL